MVLVLTADQPSAKSSLPMDTSSDHQALRSSKMDIYAHVIRALILRDMRTRFGGSHWGYAVLVLWPVAHIFIMVGIMAFRGVPSPMDNNPLLFVATGCVPALTFQYMSRETMKAIASNKPLIYYPQVKIFDVMLARIIVEIIKGFTCLLVVLAILIILGVDPFPQDPLTAIAAYCSATLLGIGIGSVNIGIVSFFPAWQLGFIVPTLASYMTCGIVFLPHLLPDQIYDLLRWNPMVHIVEWTRLAYEPSLGVNVDYAYVLLWGMASLSLGLLMERTVVRKLS